MAAMAVPTLRRRIDSNDGEDAATEDDNKGEEEEDGEDAKRSTSAERSEPFAAPDGLSRTTCPNSAVVGGGASIGGFTTKGVVVGTIDDGESVVESPPSGDDRSERSMSRRMDFKSGATV